MKRFACLVALVLGFGATTAKAASIVAATPPMGWNSWNHFRDKVRDKDIRAAADALVSSGMRDAGYVYVNIDDGWQGQRDARGVIHANAKFPDMKALADYVHSRGLKLGIYSSPGSKTCGGYAGSLGHEAQDAKTYAGWGVDYLKYDLCSFEKAPMASQFPHDIRAQKRLMVAAYARMHRALAATHRPIVYSLCQYGLDDAWRWAPGPDIGGNLWRTTGDIGLDWQSILANASQQAGLAEYAGPGHWNDPDMLEVGNEVDGRRLTPAEDRSHFSLWAMLAAPLIAGNDLSTMTPQVRKILTNKAVIAIDQDPLGKQGTRIYAKDEMEIWARTLAHGALAVAVINLGPQRYGTPPFHLDLAKLGLEGDQHAVDLWSAQPVIFNDATPITLDAHDVRLLRIDHPRWLGKS